MRVTIIPAGGLGRSAPVVIEAAQVYLSHPDGTHFAVAAEYGPDGAVQFAHAKDKNFNRVLNDLGVKRFTICDQLELPKPPPGARLVAGPSPEF